MLKADQLLPIQADLILCLPSLQHHHSFALVSIHFQLPPVESSNLPPQYSAVPRSTPLLTQHHLQTTTSPPPTFHTLLSFSSHSLPIFPAKISLAAPSTKPLNNHRDKGHTPLTPTFTLNHSFILLWSRYLPDTL